MALAFAAVILLFGAFVVYRALDPDALRGVAEARLTAVFGERVTIGRMRVALFPVPAVAGTDVRIGMRTEGAAPSVGVRRIRILPQWRTLLSKPVVIDAVEIEGLAVARLDQLYPFPVPAYAELLRGYPALREIVWAQEEPQNMGAFRSLRHRLEESLPEGATLSFAGRPWRASTSEAHPTAHLVEQDRLVRSALGVPS